MSTISESATEQDSEAFIEDTFTRVDGGLVTEIESVEVLNIRGMPKKIKIHIEKPERVGPWSYEHGKVATWDEDNCWLVELAKERGYGLEDLDGLEGEEVYVEPNDENEHWSMYSEHPREMFDEDEIGDSISVEGRETLESRDEVTEEDDIEMDCMEYETKGDYFVCEIDELVEVERDGACNIIECVVDTPYDKGLWEFKKPYGWNEDNMLVQLSESRNYGQGNFTSLVGDEVLVKRDDNEWVLNAAPPHKYGDSTRVNQSDNKSDNTGLKMVATVTIVLLLVVLLVFVVL